MNSNELIIRIISIESPRQETAGQKNKYTIETEPSHYSCNLPVKVIFNLHLTHNFNNLILISLKWFNFQTCSTNPWDFQQKIPLPGPPGLKTNDGHPPVIDTECPSKSAALKREICTKPWSQYSGKMWSFQKKHCNMKMMNSRSIGKIL